MKVRLLHPDNDITLQPDLPSWLNDVSDDLELTTLYTVMADDDRFLFAVARTVLLISVTDPVVIEYRQNVLADWMANAELLRRLYEIACDATEVHRKLFLGGLVSQRPTAILNDSVQVLQFLAANLKELRDACAEHADHFESDGMQQFIAMLNDELSDEYLGELDTYLTELRLPRGVFSSAGLGQGNRGDQFVLHNPPRVTWWDRVARNGNSTLDFSVHPRDDAGVHAINDLTEQATCDVAHTVSQSAEHVKGFFSRLRTELGFYLGCVNLAQRLTTAGIPVCFPTATPPTPHQLRCRDLRDIGLCLTTTESVIGTDVDTGTATLIVITGANEGGKSTFLRSVGAAQVMMQAGMFVTADAFQANVADGVFTHFKREEDTTMTHGKFVEELVRMSEIVDHIGSNALPLCNESFASTNEREGSQIALDVVDTLTEEQVKIIYVTHLYELAHTLYARECPGHHFLRAQRRDDGVRTFRMVSARPEPTSYGADSFHRVFGAAAAQDSGAA